MRRSSRVLSSWLYPGVSDTSSALGMDQRRRKIPFSGVVKRPYVFKAVAITAMLSCFIMANSLTASIARADVAHNISETRPSQNIPLTFGQLWEEAGQSESRVGGVVGALWGTNVVWGTNNIVAGAPPPESIWLRNAGVSNKAVVHHGDDKDRRDKAPTVTIPRVINKVFIQKTGGFMHNNNSETQTALANAHKSWHIKNQGYVIHYYDLDRCRLYLHRFFHPVFLRAFDCLQGFACKVDLFRMAVLYREGGWYSDWKEVALQDNLLDKLAVETIFFAIWDKFQKNISVSKMPSLGLFRRTLYSRRR